MERFPSQPNCQPLPFCPIHNTSHARLNFPPKSNHEAPFGAFCLLGSLSPAPLGWLDKDGYYGVEARMKKTNPTICGFPPGTGIAGPEHYSNFRTRISLTVHYARGIERHDANIHFVGHSG